MVQTHILVVEDEPSIRELLKLNLEKEGYAVNTCSSGEEAVEILKKESPNLILLDLMLPGINGLEICKKVKEDEQLNSIFIIMLSALGEESDVIHGLEIGADDYLTKPFSIKLLLARIKAVLGRRRIKLASFSSEVTFRDISIYPNRFEAFIGSEKIDLSVSEFKVLNFLIRFPGSVFTRNQIVDVVKGEDYPVTDRSVDTQVVGLRKKLGKYGDLVETVRGIGYRIKE